MLPPRPHKTHPLPTQDHSLIDQLVSTIEFAPNRDLFNCSITSIDQKIYEQYAAQNYARQQVHHELYHQPMMKSVKLEIPKINSLTDSLLKNSMGCQDNLAKSYVRILDQTQRKEQEAREKRIAEAKRKFAETNSHKDFSANSKPFMNPIHFSIQRPVIDNEHETYLKTQLILLEQPKGSNNTKEYCDKHTDMVARKINELGGMEDTIGRMEHSLSKNQVKSFKKKQVLAGMSKDRQAIGQSFQRKGSERNLRDSWINRSREMRESFMAKLQIQ